MKFVELKKNLLSKSIYSVYNLCGEDLFLIDSSKKLFFKYLIDDNELSKVILSCENLQPERFKTILYTSSFLFGNRVVYIPDLILSKNKELAKICVEYSNNPDANTTLVVVSDEPIIPEKKENSKNFCVVDCNRLDKKMMLAWLDSNLKENGTSMSPDAKDVLIDFANGYLSRISVEVEKLIAYANGRDITRQDVELLVHKDLEYGIFELTECLGRGDSVRSLQILNSLMQETKTAQSVLAMIQSYFRRMFYAVITPKTNAQIGAMLGVKEWAVAKAKQSASLFTKVALKNILELCGSLDYDVRTGKIPYKMAVDYLVFYILINSKKSQSI